MDDGLTFSLLFERALHPAPGALGGSPGRAARFALERADGACLPLPSKTEAGVMNRGDRLVIETAGGGGWGPPKV